MPRRRRSRTPPRRYSTEPLRPSTAPARTTATSPRSLLDPRRTRPAVTAIAEADVRIPQALAQTQTRRTSSGGWFRSSRNRPVTAPPVAEIVLPTTTPVASVVTSHSFRRERDGSMSSYPAATCVSELLVGDALLQRARGYEPRAGTVAAVDERSGKVLVRRAARSATLALRRS